MDEYLVISGIIEPFIYIDKWKQKMSVLQIILFLFY